MAEKDSHVTQSLLRGIQGSAYAESALSCG
jgi:hypothetical protein